MKKVCHRSRQSDNMKFCSDILRYIQLESSEYNKSTVNDKYHRSNENLDVVDETVLYTSENEINESQSSVHRAKGSAITPIGNGSDNLSYKSSDLDLKRAKFHCHKSLLESESNSIGGDINGENEQLHVYDNISAGNELRSDDSDADIAISNLNNRNDQDSIQILDKRKIWMREKSHSSREFFLEKDNKQDDKSRIVVENVSQVVEARRRSHHFLWTIPDPGSQKLNWHKPPLTVLVVKKIYDEAVLEPFTALISWLIESRKMIVFVESNVMEDDIFGDDWEKKYRERLQTFKPGHDDLTDKIDFIICLGGDGTLLHASSLFQQSCPPVMAFHQGSLGFLTPFSFDDFQPLVTNVLEGNASLLLRYRLKCVICKEDSELGRVSRIKHIDRTSPCANSQILVLNEVVVDRGSSSYICNIDLYVEGRHVTSVQGDGLIISTPTGSTAYAVAAGASMIHPNVPAIMITPICPHSLSFRPIVVPAGVELKIMLSPEARGGAMVSFDGRNRQEIFQGDSVRITTAQYPLPAICAKDQIDDWFDRLAECLHWNVRKPQKMLSVSRNNSEISNNSSNSQTNSTDSLDNGSS